jgi:hypothetical protein
VVYAYRALVEGVANAGQQKLFVEYLKYITDQDVLSYRPGSDRDSAFAEGKRFVGLELAKLLHPLMTPPSKSRARPLALAQERLRAKYQRETPNE